MPAVPATDALAVLEQMALDQEAANRYATQGKRTVEHVVDPTPWGTVPRCRLVVIAAYRRFFEDMCLYGNTGVCERLKAKTFLVYGCLWMGSLTPVPLTREQAIELMETRELPVALWPATASLAPDEEDAEGWSVKGFLATVKPTAVRHRVGKVGTR